MYGSLRRPRSPDHAQSGIIPNFLEFGVYRPELAGVFAIDLEASPSCQGWTETCSSCLLMNHLVLQLYARVQILKDENGQDLIEYALVVALICFAATVGMNTVAQGINDAFSKVASKLASAIT